MKNLFSDNTPLRFWNLAEEISDGIWQRAIKQAMPLLGFHCDMDDIDDLLQIILGEGRFGTDHWRLGLSKQMYYIFKPLVPRFIRLIIRQLYQNRFSEESRSNWPIDARYVLFQWEIMRQILMATNSESISYKSFWPKGHRFAFTLTHDVETAEGQTFVRKVADLEESLGFRSSFNFVLEHYPLDFGLIRELRERGFEVGCHGLKHDGKLYSTKTEFIKRAVKINEYMRRYEMVGFRSPLTHRNPEWMQTLDIMYDLSFFDTDPFEPIPGGVMSIWPFFIGHFIELPYTLVQDYTLTAVLGETSPRIWLNKVAFIEKYHGLALMNSHPDYLKEKNNWEVYLDFLSAMKNRGGYWHALPRENASWWQLRTHKISDSSSDAIHLDIARLEDGHVVLVQ